MSCSLVTGVQTCALPISGESDAPAWPAHALSILVVEDDARVLAATVDAVSELGHSAVACGNPLEAEALVEGRLAEGRGGFDLLLSDVLMPELTIGRAAGRARGVQYGWNSVVRVSRNKKQKN